MAFTLADLLVRFKTDQTELDKGFERAEQETSRWGGAINVAVGNMLSSVITGGITMITGAISDGLSAVVGFSGDMANVQRDLQAQLGVSTQKAEIMSGVVRGVFGNNFGDDVADVQAGVVAIQQTMGQVTSMMGDPALYQQVVESAFAIRDAFEVDVADSASAASTLMEKFGLSGQEAMDFITFGMQKGLNASGDFLDTIGEYSGQFLDMGFSAEDFFSILSSGQQGGVLGTDKIADAIKELNIRLSEGSSSTAAAFGQLGLNFEDIQANVASGEGEWSDYFYQITSGLDQIADPMARQQAAVALFGAGAEDLGSSLTSASDAVYTMEDMAGAAEGLNVQYGSLGEAVEGYKRRALVALEPVGAALLGLANETMPLVEMGFQWFETNLVPAITAAAEKAGLFFSTFGDGIANGQAPLDAFQASIAATFGAEAAQKFEDSRVAASGFFADVSVGAGVAQTAINGFWNDTKVGADLAADSLGVSRTDLQGLFADASVGAGVAQEAINAFWGDAKTGADVAAEWLGVAPADFASFFGDVSTGAFTAQEDINGFWNDAKAGADLAADWLGVSRTDLAGLFADASAGALTAKTALQEFWADAKVGYDTYMQPIILGIQDFNTWLGGADFGFNFEWPEIPEWAQMNSPMKLHTGLMDLHDFTSANPIAVQFQASGLESITNGFAALANGGGVVNNYNVDATVNTAATNGTAVGGDLAGGVRSAIKARGM